MEKGFIRAQIVSADELIEIGDLHEIRSGATCAPSGKSHCISDGDVVGFFSTHDPLSERSSAGALPAKKPPLALTDHDPHLFQQSASDNAMLAPPPNALFF